MLRDLSFLVKGIVRSQFVLVKGLAWRQRGLTVLTLSETVLICRPVDILKRGRLFGWMCPSQHVDLLIQNACVI